MKFRWTKKDLEEKSDSEILRGLIVERKYGLNPYSPLSRRLNTIYQKLSIKINNEIHKI